jgi:hypothetical protein
MKALGATTLLFLAALLVKESPASAGTDLYGGQTPPGDVPAVFAPGVISKKGRFEQFLLYSPDGRVLTFGLTNSDWRAFTLYEMRVNGDGFGPARVAPYQGSDSTGLTSCQSFDSRTAFFTASRPRYPPCDIWMSQRRDSGWSEPVKLGPPVSSDADEFEVSVARSGTLYFSSTRKGGQGDIDIYRARPVDGRYPSVENLGPPVNTASGDDLPYIAPDESYLIFASNRAGGLGERDLYISFRVHGVWSETKNLGAPINSEYWDIYPSVSPDGKYLFFTRRKAWQTDEDSDIYWVSAAFIDRLREGVNGE